MSEMMFRGRKATVVIELEMNRGAVLRIPVGDLASYHQDAPNSAFGTLTLPIGRPLLEQLYLGEAEARRDIHV
jgi:hypothetical protein